MATPLEDVGKQVRVLPCSILMFMGCAQSWFSFKCFPCPQVWRAAFLLADYILFQRDTFRGCSVLELGGGTGITSIIMGTVAKRVYCTGEAVFSVKYFHETCQSSAFIVIFSDSSVQL